jgi:membrane protease YdiL (CAAX protease family)
MQIKPENKKRIILFLAFAFGISWVTALIIFITGGLENSPVLDSTSGLSLAYLLLAGPYMWGPALANLLTRLVTREGNRDYGLKPEVKQTWRYWVTAWVAPAILIALGAVLYFILFPQHLDGGFQTIRMQIALSGQDPNTISIPELILVQSLLAILIAPVLNGIATFGEEFGWRAYLLPKLLDLGVKKALIISGIIWGVWHWPVIAMGYNYGSGYFGAPWLGMLMMVWVTMAWGVLIGWLTLRGKSVWPAVIAHGALNGFAAISTLVTRGSPSPLVGPLPTGVIASLPFVAAALWVLLSPKALEGLETKEITVS